MRPSLGVQVPYFVKSLPSVLLPPPVIKRTRSDPNWSISICSIWFRDFYLQLWENSMNDPKYPYPYPSQGMRSIWSFFHFSLVIPCCIHCFLHWLTAQGERMMVALVLIFMSLPTLLPTDLHFMWQEPYSCYEILRHFWWYTVIKSGACLIRDQLFSDVACLISYF